MGKTEWSVLRKANDEECADILGRLHKQREVCRNCTRCQKEECEHGCFVTEEEEMSYAKRLLYDAMKKENLGDMQ